MKKLLFVGLLAALAAAACVHGPPAHWDTPNPPDAGTAELKWD